MSILQKISGNASHIPVEECKRQIGELLIETEEVVIGFQLIRDSIIFTTERLMMIDVQGLTGKKKSYTSIPFSSIKWYSMETAGTFDLDSEIKIQVHGMSMPMTLKFAKGSDISAIYALLSRYTLRDN